MIKLKDITSSSVFSEPATKCVYSLASLHTSGNLSPFTKDLREEELLMSRLLIMALGRII